MVLVKQRVRITRDSYWRARKLLGNHETGRWKAIDISATIGVPYFADKDTFIMIGKAKFKKTTDVRLVRIGKLACYETKKIRCALRILGHRIVEIGIYTKDNNPIMGLWYKRNLVLIAPQLIIHEAEAVELHEVLDKIPQGYALCPLWQFLGEGKRNG